jgi:hypothetical protein
VAGSERPREIWLVFFSRSDAELFVSATRDIL